MTLVGYFNSLRELGGMRRLVEDDVAEPAVPHRRGRAAGGLIIEELTSRKSASDIPATLDQLGVERLSQEKRTPAKEGRYAPLPIDVLLATNMISVGVDVPRLGLMVVAGQPKSTAEYIQATSRVGRAVPGARAARSTTGRGRATCRTTRRSSTTTRRFYRQVEALSVTPFAPRALDRGLTGVLASLLRLSGPEWNDNPGAGKVDPAATRARVGARRDPRARRRPDRRGDGGARRRGS